MYNWSTEETKLKKDKERKKLKKKEAQKLKGKVIE
jgi:hypothetical protein